MAASVQVARFLKSLGDLNIKRAPGLMRLNHYGLIAPERVEQRQLSLMRQFSTMWLSFTR
jgi:hypothetical protein